jgi:hypothetical protein
MRDTLKAMGYAETPVPDLADLVIFNTCHIREHAAEKVYSELGRMKRLKKAKEESGGEMLVAVAGCVAQAEGAEIIRRAKAVDLVFGPQTYHRLPDLIARRLKTGDAIVETEFPAEDKFEALAALDRFEEARNSLQDLRKNRFGPAALPPILSTGAALMNTVRDERRKELCFESHRWFDLRRYAVNAKYPFSKTIRHTSYVFAGTEYIENGYYELGTYEQDAAAYIVPIANNEITFNGGLLTNERRPDRPLKH